jgi:hypothetical protein
VLVCQPPLTPGAQDGNGGGHEASIQGNK